MNEKKQIEEMAQDIYDLLPDYEHNFLDCRRAAEEMFARGYRKQNKGAWIQNDHGDTICPFCRLPVNYKSNYCPACGAETNNQRKGETEK